MGFTTPAAVNKIVLNNIGGTPLQPAQTTIMEGRPPAPQISTLCSLGDSIKSGLAEIGDAIDKFKQGIDEFVINPLKDVITAAQAALTSALAAVNAVIAAVGEAVDAIVTEIKAAITAAVAAVTKIFDHIQNMITDGLQEIMAAASFCSPTDKVPKVKKYTTDDFTGSLKKNTEVATISTQAASAAAILANPTLSAGDITSLTYIKNQLTANTATVSTQVDSDVNKLNEAQLQMQAQNKLMVMANGMNNPDTAAFTNTIMNPNGAIAITETADGMVRMKFTI